MARPKTYHIILSDNEVSALRKVIRDTTPERAVAGKPPTLSTIKNWGKS